MRRLFVLAMRHLFVLCVACGNSSSPPTTAPPAPPAAQVDQPPPPAPGPAADRFAALAIRLGDVQPLAKAADAVVAIHAWPTWKTIAATATSYRRLERADLDTAVTELATLRSTLQRATAELRDGKVADAIARVDAAVSAVFAGKLGTLPSDIIDELAFDRDEVCAKYDERVPCDHIRELHTGYDYAQATKQAIRDTLTTTAIELAKALPGADVHTRTVLTKATGEGPAFGEPCGPEELCKWNNRCEHPSNTCEHACSQMAMEPCPGPYRCVSVPSLTGTFCRR